MFLLLAGFLCFSLPAEAQLLKKIKQGAEKAAERAVISKTEQKVTRETEKAMDTVLNNGQSSTSSAPAVQSDSRTSPAIPVAEENSSAPASSWSRYNFVPGDVIIFEDDLGREENGEFPSRWDLVSGSAENASLDGAKIINFEKNSIVTPLINKEDYLPEVFTMEFDAYFNDTYSHWQEYVVRFYRGDDTQRQVSKELVVFPLHINKNGASILHRLNNDNKDYRNQGPGAPDGKAGWKHIAISYNQRALKVFLDQDRILNIPNIELDPTAISIQAIDGQKDHIMAIKNIRIAEGGKKLYDRIVADGKFTNPWDPF